MERLIILKIATDSFFTMQIPDPQAYLVTNWGRDPNSGMAYSYIPIGSTGEEYDHLACAVDNKLFFAGEVCYVLSNGCGWMLSVSNCKWTTTVQLNAC